MDLVFGPQTLHRLPDMIAELRRTGRSQVDVSFPEIEKFDHLPAPRAEGATAFVSIMEGCSKYCSFCIVPYTRGDEVSRPFDSVLDEDPAACARKAFVKSRFSDRTSTRMPVRCQMVPWWISLH